MQRQLVDVLLAEDEFHIVTAGNGRDALQYLKEHTPSLVMLALELPDVGGDVVCRKLKAVSRLSRVPVILTAQPGPGASASDLRQLARSVGADMLLQKPVGDKGLREKVNQLLRRWHGRQGGRPAPGATKNTAVIEEALQELGDAGGDPGAMDAVTESLYRENEELRNEVAALKRRLARLESGLAEGGEDPPSGFVAGSAPAEPAAVRASRAGQRSSAAHQARQTRNGDAPRPATDSGRGGRGAADAPRSVAGDWAGMSEENVTGEHPLPDALPPDASYEALQRRVAELERRNRALLAALEEAQAERETPRQPFWRRRR